jgi:NADPH-dependent ferric siderophore reductase
MRPSLVRVTRVQPITPRITRITLSGVDIVCPTPDAYVKLFFPLPGQDIPALAPAVNGDVVSWYRSYLAMPDHVRPPMRTYTVRAHRPGSFDVDFILHGSGPGSTWAARAEIGDTVAFLGPTGVHSVPLGTRWQLLIGDETAVPAIGSIIESAPAGSVIRAFIQADPSEWQHFPADVRWLPADLLGALRAAPLEDGVYAWIAGESAMVRAVRRHLVSERGISRKAVTFTGYWRRGMSEEDVGRVGLHRIEAGLSPEED